MTETPGLEWLTVGATVAYISGGTRSESVSRALVDKIGKRDVRVIVGGRDETFNIGKTWDHDGVLWLRRSGNSAWARGTELAPWDHPQVVAYRAAGAIAHAVYLVRKASDEFSKSRGVEDARVLRTVVDAYLKLAEEAISCLDDLDMV